MNFGYVINKVLVKKYSLIRYAIFVAIWFDNCAYKDADSEKRLVGRRNINSEESRLVKVLNSEKYIFF